MSIKLLESRAIGADCILLIHGVSEVLDRNEDLTLRLAHQLNMDVLVGTHNYDELLYWLETKRCFNT